MNKLNNETLDQMETIAKIAARAVEMIKITLDKAGCTKPEKEPEFAKLADWRGRWLQLDGYECNSNGMLALLRDRFAETVRSIVQRPGYTLFTTESGMMLSSNGYVFTDHDERVTTAKLVRIAMTERIKDHPAPFNINVPTTAQKPETIDLTPTPDSYRAMLRLIIKHSPVPLDVVWATKELAKVENVTKWGKQ